MSARFQSFTSSQKKALGIATIIALLYGAYFLRHYFMLVVVAAIVAYLFNPVYQWMVRKWNKPGMAGSLTLLITFLVIIIPVGLLMFVAGIQLQTLADNIRHHLTSEEFAKTSGSVLDKINSLLASNEINYKLTSDTVTEKVVSYFQTAAPALIKNITSSLSSVFSLISTSIIYIYVFLSVLRHQDALVNLFKKLNPLGDEVSDMYLEKTGDMTKATVRGQFIIAIVQGFTDALLIYIGGVHGFFIPLFLILSALSVIPLGGGILAIPIGIIMALTGNVIGGVIVIGGHLLIVTNEDNILRPKLVPQSARLDSALMLLAVFSGIAIFGFIGIVLGPVIMILIVTTIQVYLEVYKNVEQKKHEKEPPKKKLGWRLKSLRNKLSRKK